MRQDPIKKWVLEGCASCQQYQKKMSELQPSKPCVTVNGLTGEVFWFGLALEQQPQNSIDIRDCTGRLYFTQASSPFFFPFTAVCRNGLLGNRKLCKFSQSSWPIFCLFCSVFSSHTSCKDASFYKVGEHWWTHLPSNFQWQKSFAGHSFSFKAPRFLENGHDSVQISFKLNAIEFIIRNRHILKTSKSKFIFGTLLPQPELPLSPR